MRITTNMLVQQLVQAAKSEGAQKAEVGAAITARISEVLNGVLTLDIGAGKPMAARDLSGQNYSAGQTVTFNVVGFDENGALQLRPAGNEPSLEADTQNLNQLLKKLNLPDTEGNRELLRTLSAYRIPLNSGNIKAAQGLSVQAKGIVQLAEQAGTGVLAEHETEPLKQIATRLIEMTSGVGKEASAEKAIPGKIPTGLNLEATGNPPAVSDASLKAAFSKNPGVTPDALSSMTGQTLGTEKSSVSKNSEVPVHGDIPKSQLANTPVIKSELTPADKILEKQVNETLRGNELKEVLKQLTSEKIGFVIKNQLPSDLGTLNTLDKLILGKKELGIQLRDLLDNLPKNEASAPLREAIQNAVKSVHINQEMNPFDLQKQLKSLNHALTTLSAQVTETIAGSNHLKESLAEVKSSLDFLGRLSESATYLHVPVTLGQGTKPMDIYVQRDKSGKKKVNPQDTRIFISLETNHMETVQCLVEVQEKKLNIGFKLTDSDALALISKTFAPLKESLNQLGYKDVVINGMVYQRPMNLMDITQDPPLDLRRIDVRV